MLDVDELAARVAAIGEDPGALFKAALWLLGDAVECLKPGCTRDDARAFFDGVGTAYLAIGTMIGADRRMMVESLRPPPADLG